jgi:hypothetical protein
MTIEEFETLLLAHGASPARWPAERRGAAEALLARDAAARALLREAERLDAVVAAGVAAPAAGGALAARILDGLDAAPPERILGLGRLFAWTGSTAAAALLAGFLVGQGIGGPDPSANLLALMTGDLTEIEAMP